MFGGLDSDTLISLELAAKKLRLGNAQQALQICEQVLAEDSDCIEALYLKVVIRQREGTLDDAIALTKRILELEPDHFDTLRLQGELLWSLGNPKDSLYAYHKLTELQPQNKDAWHDLGHAFFMLHIFDQAKVCFENLVKLAPDEAGGYHNLGLVHRHLQQYDQAIDAYQKAIALEPENIDAYNNLAAVYFKKHDFEKSAEICRKAIEIDPMYAISHINLGNAYHDIGMVEEALVCHRRGLALDPNLFLGHMNLGNVLFELGKREAAIKSYQDSLTLEPNNVDAWFNLGTARFNESDYGPAIEAMTKAVSLAKGLHPVVFYLALLHALNGDKAQAQELLDRLGTSYPEFHSSFSLIQEKRTKKCRYFSHTFQTLRHALEHVSIDGLHLEFGVRFGASIRYIASLTETTIHGFDSFQGLPEGWAQRPEGVYSTHGQLPQVPDHVSLHVGWFSETLPGFLQQHEGPIAFMNIDCDIYSSTHDIFTAVGHRVASGTIIVFDEYLFNPHWDQDEHKAFIEAAETYGWAYEYISFGIFSKQAAIRIL